jgi:hypothetical protein
MKTIRFSEPKSFQSCAKQKVAFLCRIYAGNTG